MHVSPFLPMDARLPHHLDRPRAPTCASASTSERGGTHVFDAASRSTGSRSTAATPSPCSLRHPLDAAAGVGRDLPRGGHASSSAEPGSYRIPNAGTVATDEPDRGRPPARGTAWSTPDVRRGGTLERVGPLRHASASAAPVRRGYADRRRGHRPRRPRFYARLLAERSVGLGESYADGWWDADDLTGVPAPRAPGPRRTHPLRDRVHRAIAPVRRPVARRRRARPEAGPERTSGRTTTSATSCSSGSSTTR